MFWFLGNHPEDGTGPEPLSQVNIMPIDNIFIPSSHAGMNFAGQIQKPILPRPVIQPEHAFDVLTGPEFGPIAFAEGADRKPMLPLEIPGHDVQDPAIATELVVALQYVEHEHMGPEVWFAVQAGKQGPGAEPAVLPLGSHGRFDPLFRLDDQFLIAQHIAQVAETSQPVGHLFPAILALAVFIGPGALLEVEPG